MVGMAEGAFIANDCTRLRESRPTLPRKACIGTSNPLHDAIKLDANTPRARSIVEGLLEGVARVGGSTSTFPF